MKIFLMKQWSYVRRYGKKKKNAKVFEKPKLPVANI